LGLKCIQHKRPLQGLSAAALADRNQLLVLALRQTAGIMQKATNQRTLAVIDMPDNHNTQLLRRFCYFFFCLIFHLFIFRTLCNVLTSCIRYVSSAGAIYGSFFKTMERITSSPVNSTFTLFS